MGRIQARTIKARRRHGEQTCRPAGVLRAHYHASFLHLIQSIGLLCTGSLLPVQIMKQKTHSNPHRNFGNNIENRTSSVWARYGSWSDNCSLSFWVNTTKEFLWRLILTSTGPDLAIYAYNQPARKRGKILKKFDRRGLENYWSGQAQKDPLVSLNQQGGSQAASVPQKIPYHDASQPPKQQDPSQNANEKTSEKQSANLTRENHASKSKRETFRIGRRSGKWRLRSWDLRQRRRRGRREANLAKIYSEDGVG